jgi:predicted type IV restriction endonuclease
MDFVDQIKTIAQSIEKMKGGTLNEAATINCFIMPFIKALDYDTTNPLEVYPEFTADVPVLNNNKVDFAILADNKPIILIECKCYHDQLDNIRHTAQLHKYFQNTEAKFGILTNGTVYRFYTDIDKSHVMDTKPFFEFNLNNFSDSDINELKNFSKANFNSSSLSKAAETLLYTKEIKRLMTEQLTNPSPNFVKFFAGQVYSKNMTTQAVEKFTTITKTSLKEFISEIIAEKIKTAMDDDVDDSSKEDKKEDPKVVTEKEIVTTKQELEGFYLVKGILREVIDVNRVRYKDTVHYFGINLDGKVTKTICRLYFNSSKLGVDIMGANDQGVKKEINCLDDIYRYAEFLKDRVNYLANGTYTEESKAAEEVR